ncbi:protein shisa-5 isoform 1-T1 [Pangshura tecta]
MVPAGGCSRLALSVLLLLASASGESCRAYTDSDGHTYSEKSCPQFCCGNCISRYCCLDRSYKFGEDEQFMCNVLDDRTYQPIKEETLKLRSHFGDDWEPRPSFGTFVAIGVTLFVVFIVTVILCFTCSCCCLYKMCRRQRPVVTTTTSTTVVHAPYPQQPGIPPGYPVAPYQGYHPVPVQPQPGMPAAPYPTQYPPPYPTQVSGPPAYQETMAASAGAPYPVNQPPYNPAYMDPQKPIY